MPDLPISRLQALDRLLNRGMYNGVSFTLTCRNEFEPHGRASETWETAWVLSIPDIPYHWRGADQVWREGTVGGVGCMTFSSRTADAVANKAILFLEESGAKQVLT